MRRCGVPSLLLESSWLLSATICKRCFNGRANFSLFTGWSREEGWCFRFCIIGGDVASAVEAADEVSQSIKLDFFCSCNLNKLCGKAACSWELTVCFSDRVDEENFAGKGAELGASRSFDDLDVSTTVKCAKFRFCINVLFDREPANDPYNS